MRYLMILPALFLFGCVNSSSDSSSAQPHAKFALACAQSNSPSVKSGSPDLTWGQNGSVTLSFEDIGQGLIDDQYFQVQTSDCHWASLYSGHQDSYGTEGIATIDRLNSDGSVDSTFADHGRLKGFALPLLYHRY